MMSWSSSEVTLPLGLQPLEWLLLEARAVRAGAPGPAGEHWGFRDPETGGRPTAGAPWGEQCCQRQYLVVWPAGGGWMGGTGSRPWQQWHCKTTGLSSVTSAFCSTGRFTLLGGRAMLCPWHALSVPRHGLQRVELRCGQDGEGGLWSFRVRFLFGAARDLS